MTAQVLSAELTNLIQESKRKNSELRNVGFQRVESPSPSTLISTLKAAEKSLQDLKSLPSTSEEQLAADLVRRPQFIAPFLIACGTKSAKFANSAVICLQRLSVSQGLPKERLREVLEAFSECTALGLEIQLKILQALPSLLQNYSEELKGELLRTTLEVCSSLQASKNPAVSGTAIATLQQLISSVFDKVASEDERALEIPSIAEVPVENGSVAVKAAAQDAYKVFHDLCAMAQGNQPKFIRIALSQASDLELIESALTNHGTVFSRHPEQSHLLKSLLMPLLIRYLSEKLSFSITVRVFRILQILIRDHLAILSEECEAVLGLLNQQLDPEASPPWKRALSMEVFRTIYADPALVLDIYANYDGVAGKKQILRDNLSTFVRISTEKPAAIGLGQYSTAPVTQTQARDAPAEQAAIEAGAGLIGGPSPPMIVPATTGIGVWSNMRTPCIDHLDKSDAPSLPETYLYSLVLSCITNLSEGLAKFILPLTVHAESRNKKRSKTQEISEEASAASPSDDSASQGKLKRRVSRTQSFRKKTVPQNPLTLETHKAYPHIKSAAALIGDCWPAVLATCSTFLNSSLDADVYRTLVRSIQKFTQVAGLLRLPTPRDAFLTMLGKNAVPSHVVSSIAATSKATPTEHGVLSNAKGLLNVENLVSPTSTASFEKSRRSSLDNSALLNTRNLLCLRALLNLAIALGPTLDEAWSIVFETLQQADIVLAVTTGKSGGRDPRTSSASQRSDGDSSMLELGSEVTAVQSAASRLFESTVDFPNDAFVSVLEALCGLLRGAPASTGSRAAAPVPGGRPLHQRRVGSISGPIVNTNSDAQDYMLALTKVGDVAVLNLPRLTHYEAEESGWAKLVNELVSILSNRFVANPARRMAAEILGQIGKDMTKLSMNEEPEAQSEVQSTVLAALRAAIDSLRRDIQPKDAVEEGAIEIHEIILESLKSVLEQCGESLTAGWSSVFSILSSVFRSEKPPAGSDGDTEHSIVAERPSFVPQSRTISRRLARSAFGSVHLICSDFLASIPDEYLSTLLDLILRFSSQQQDLNISLSTITFFWNVSDFLPSRSQNISFAELMKPGGDRQNIAEQIRSLAHQGSIPGLWLLVLLHLTVLSVDDRADVRNGSIQTIARIFDNSGDQLSPDSWYLCIRSVLFELIGSNLNVQKSVRSSADARSVDEIAAWNNTSKMILETISNLLSSYVGSIRKHENFHALWETLAEFHTGYLSCHSHALNTAVYSSISDILAKSEGDAVIGMPTIERMLRVWMDYFPEETTSPDIAQTNQDAFLAYIRALKEIYRLYKSHLRMDMAIKIIQNLRRTVEESDAAAYSADADYTTDLQKQVMEILAVICADMPDVVSDLLSLLANFIVLPYSEKPPDSLKRRPTFVALSKAAMSLAQDIIPKHVTVAEIYTSGSTVAILNSLAVSIAQKNKWRVEGKGPTTWQSATTAAVIILKSVLGNIEKQSLDKDVVRPLWEETVMITERIAHADIAGAPASAPIAEYEEFDISALASLRDVMTPLLGSPIIPDSTRRAYTSSLFSSSLIHACEPGEIPKPDEAPLQGLYNIRLGRTFDPAPSARTGMAYFCLSELGSLISAHDGSIERVKLAQAAAPYFILRAALTLKAYISDQPLRGRMPQPFSQRQELTFVLRQIKELDSEPKAIPDAPGVTSTHKKHLHRLYPLLIKVGYVAQRDDEVSKEVMGVLELVGDEFGI